MFFFEQTCFYKIFSLFFVGKKKIQKYKISFLGKVQNLFFLKKSFLENRKYFFGKRKKSFQKYFLGTKNKILNFSLFFQKEKKKKMNNNNRNYETIYLPYNNSDSIVLDNQDIFIYLSFCLICLFSCVYLFFLYKVCKIRLQARRTRERLERITSLSPSSPPPPINYYSLAETPNLQEQKVNSPTNKLLPECCICLQPYKEDQWITYLGCFHSFHKTCIDKWLDKKCVCPLCKLPIYSTSNYRIEKEETTGNLLV